jgi:hypothetical protein
VKAKDLVGWRIRFSNLYTCCTTEESWFVSLQVKRGFFPSSKYSFLPSELTKPAILHANRSFSLSKADRAVKFTSTLPLVPRLRVNGA